MLLADRDNHYYWELLVLLRRSVLVLINVVSCAAACACSEEALLCQALYLVPAWKATATVLYSVFFLLVCVLRAPFFAMTDALCRHLHAMPFRNPLENQLETISLVSCARSNPSA